MRVLSPATAGIAMGLVLPLAVLVIELPAATTTEPARLPPLLDRPLRPIGDAARGRAADLRPPVPAAVGSLMPDRATAFAGEPAGPWGHAGDGPEADEPFPAALNHAGWSAPVGGTEPACAIRYPAPPLGGIEIGGWIDQGVTFNPDSPRNHSNAPIGYNDRSNAYQLNQLWITIEKAVDTCGGGWDLGGRVDLAFGTDSRFLTADGLEDRWNSGQRFYQLALPQLYMELGVERLSVKMGHLWSPFGYERGPAPDNFFYSHAVSFTQIQPRTFTGLLGTYRLTDQWSVDAGLHRGWDNWEDENNHPGVVAGVSWSSCDRRTSASFAVSSAEEGDEIITPDTPLSTNVFELIVTHQVTGNLVYVIEHTNTRGTTTKEYAGLAGTSADSHAYGINQYLIYQIDPCWSAGMRMEWLFESLTLRDLAPGRTAGSSLDLYALTWGLNWTPTDRLAVRPELRWDWSDGRRYDDSSDHEQLLFACDALWSF